MEIRSLGGSRFRVLGAGAGFGFRFRVRGFGAGAGVVGQPFGEVSLAVFLSKRGTEVRVLHRARARLGRQRLVLE